MFTFWKNLWRCNISKFQFVCVSPSVSCPVCRTSSICLSSHKEARFHFLLILPAVIHHVIANRIIVIVLLLIHLILLLIILITFLVATSIIRCPSANDLSRSWLVHASQPEALPKANQVFQHLPRHCQRHHCPQYLHHVHLSLTIFLSSSLSCILVTNTI